MRFPGFIGPSYTLDSVDIDAQRCVNWYPKMNEMGKGKEGEVAALIATPGLSLLVTLGNGPIRGVYRASNGFLYAVSGNKLYYINSSWEALNVGTLETSAGKVSMADNGSTLVVVDGDNGYWHTLSSATITAFSGVAWLGSTHVSYLDGYFIFNDPGTGKFYISDIDAITLDALDFATAQSSPDDTLATLVNHRELWIFGEGSVEGWYNSGNADFPFERIGGGVLEGGLGAAFSVAKIDKSVLWLSKDDLGHGMVYLAQGFNPQRISTHAVEHAIQSYGDISSATAWAYQENGHRFYVLNFATAKTSWVYDLTTGLWHERAYLNGGEFNRHRADCHAFAYNTHVVGDYENGKIYKLDSTAYSDAGDEIKRIRRAPHLSASGNRVQHNMFQLDCETGTGLAGSSQGNDPKMMMRFSDDGGHTWSNEKWRDLGKEGNKKTRLIWRKLGMSRDRVYEVSISDPVKANLTGANIETEVMAS